MLLNSHHLNENEVYSLTVDEYTFNQASEFFNTIQTDYQYTIKKSAICGTRLAIDSFRTAHR